MRVTQAAREALSGIDAVLVTGARGFVGRHLCAALEQLGKKVARASSRSAFHPERDPLALDGVGHVFHAAAKTSVPAAWQDPAGFVEANTLGTVRVLDQCRRHGCGVTFLSAYVYGVPQSIPIREDHRVDPNNPYALSKHLAEQACSFYATAFGLNVAALRLFNLYGPGQDERFLVPFIARQLLDPSCETIEVLDLAPKRDYIFIDDTVDAILRSARAPAGSIFNVGSGDAYSVEEIILHMCSAAGVAKPYAGKAERRQNEIDLTKSDNSAIARAIGWTPTTSIDEGLLRVVKGLSGS